MNINMIIPLSTGASFLFHRYLMWKTGNDRMTQYGLSLSHGIITTILYLLPLRLKDYEEEFDKNELLAIGLHLGYYLSDTLVEYRRRNIGFMIHHIYSIYFILLNYHLGTTGIFQRSMMVAESTAVVLNARTIYIKICGHKEKWMEMLLLLNYVSLRFGYCSYLLQDYIRNYPNVDWRIVTSIGFFLAMVAKWSVELGTSIYKMPRIKTI